MTNRGYNIIRQLAQSFDLCLLAFSRRNHQPGAQDRERAVERLDPYVDRLPEPVPIPGERSPGRRLWDHLRSVLIGHAYTFFEYSSPDFAAKLRDALATWKPDLVHLDSLDLYRWLDVLPTLPKTCTHHSIESELLRLRADRIDSAPLRAYMNYQAGLLENVERKNAPSFALNLMMSDVDANRLARLAPGSRTAVVPNGVDTKQFRPPDPSRQVADRVVFLGPTYMFPNRDAVSFLLDQIWPRLKGSLPGASLHLIGRCPKRDRAEFESVPDVACLGYVEDIRPEFARAQCCVVPLRVGGGTRLKILDAWALGTPVVSTAIGCEGLDARDGSNILIRDDPADFADAVVKVCLDEDLRMRLRECGRATARSVYDWDVVGSQLRELYTGLLSQTI